VRYFFDNSISYRLAKMLAALGVDAVALRDEFPEDIKDVALLRALRGREVVFVAADRRQLTRIHEAAELRSARITALYFAPFWSKQELWDQAAWLVKRWPKIDGFANGVAQGTIAEVKQNRAALVILV
jgi:hypothetical protein